MLYRAMLTNDIKTAARNPVFFLIAIISVTAFFTACADNRQTRTTSWPDGTPKEEWTIIVDKAGNEIREGRYRAWHKNGQMAEEGSFRDGLKDGIWTKWYGGTPNIKIMEGAYVSGEMDGRWRFWMDPSHSDNMSHSQVEHHDEHASDHSREFVHPKPTKFSEFRMGMPHGLSLSWHHNGQVADSLFYVDGNIEGTFISYHPNGQPAMKAEYHGGVRKGKQLFWDENGNVVKEIE